jgi:hypothetical protein
MGGGGGGGIAVVNCKELVLNQLSVSGRHRPLLEIVTFLFKKGVLVKENSGGMGHVPLTTGGDERGVHKRWGQHHDLGCVNGRNFVHI